MEAVVAVVVVGVAAVVAVVVMRVGTWPGMGADGGGHVAWDGW